MGSTDTYMRQFELDGLVRIEGMVSVDAAHRAREMVLRLAETHGLLQDGSWTTSPSRFGYPKPFRDALNSLSRAPEFPELVDARLGELAARLVGHSVAPLSPGQQILFTLPGQEKWSVPRDAWHVDLPRMGERASPGLQVFTFLDDVEPSGGGTLVLAGSHRLENSRPGLSSGELKRLLRHEPFFQDLFDPARAEIEQLDSAHGSAQGVNLSVVELSGKVGEAYLMDLRVLHTPAPNSSNRARMMLTCRLPRKSIVEAFSGSQLAP